jgi:hypothetical protein
VWENSSQLLQINGGIKSKETKLSFCHSLVKYLVCFCVPAKNTNGQKTPTARNPQRLRAVARPSPSKPPSATALFFFSLWAAVYI